MPFSAEKLLPLASKPPKIAPGTPEIKSRSGSGTVCVWDKDGRPRTIEAVTKQLRGVGLQVDGQGHMYVSCGYTRGRPVDGLGDTKLRGLGPMRPFGSVSDIRKFLDKGGIFPIGSMVDRKKNPIGQAWAYQGQSPSAPSGHDCGCAHSDFAIDLFARVFVPTAHLYSIMVLDTNGNKIMRLGRYGNADCRGPDSLSPDPDIGLHWVMAVEPSDKALYISDAGNQRIVKAKMGYETQESCPIK
jgi:hypothetical protein